MGAQITSVLNGRLVRAVSQTRGTRADVAGRSMSEDHKADHNFRGNFPTNDVRRPWSSADLNLSGSYRWLRTEDTTGRTAGSRFEKRRLAGLDDSQRTTARHEYVVRVHRGAPGIWNQSS